MNKSKGRAEQQPSNGQRFFYRQVDSMADDAITVRLSCLDGTTSGTIDLPTTPFVSKL